MKAYGKYYLRHKNYAYTDIAAYQQKEGMENEGLIEVCYEGTVVCWTLKKEYAQLIVWGLLVYNRLGKIIEALQKPLSERNTQ